MSLSLVEPVKRIGKYSKICKRSEYLDVQSSGARFKQRHLMMLYTSSTDSVEAVDTKFGITVSRKVGNAVVRNRVKRRLREVIRNGNFTLPGAWKVVIIARPCAANVSYRVLEKDFVGFTSWLSKRAS